MNATEVGKDLLQSSALCLFPLLQKITTILWGGLFEVKQLLAKKSKKKNSKTETRSHFLSEILGL